MIRNFVQKKPYFVWNVCVYKQSAHREVRTFNMYLNSDASARSRSRSVPKQLLLFQSCSQVRINRDTAATRSSCCRRLRSGLRSLTPGRDACSGTALGFLPANNLDPLPVTVSNKQQRAVSCFYHYQLPAAGQQEVGLWEGFLA